jgi:hypothetical protein
MERYHEVHMEVDDCLVLDDCLVHDQKELGESLDNPRVGNLVDSHVDHIEDLVGNNQHHDRCNQRHALVDDEVDNLEVDNLELEVDNLVAGNNRVHVVDNNRVREVDDLEIENEIVHVDVLENESVGESENVDVVRDRDFDLIIVRDVGPLVFELYSKIRSLLVHRNLV